MVGSPELSSNTRHKVEYVTEASKLEPIHDQQENRVVNVELMEVDEIMTRGLPNDSNSMIWVLGSHERFLLTSERPNKKRKFLGRDAGLDQLLRLPYPNSKIPELCCDACYLGPSGDVLNPFIQCGLCKVTVHRKCYGVKDDPAGEWLCSWCRQLEVKKDLRHCVLCPREGGALKPVGDDAGGGYAMKFAHLFCSMWAPEVYVEDTRVMEPVLNVGGVHETRRKLVCYLCKVKHGVCVRCSHGTCRTSFHPLCARESKHRMEIWGKFGCDNIELRAFCSKHSRSHDANRGKQSENLKANFPHNSSFAKPPPPVLPMNKLPKLKLGHSVRDKSMSQGESPYTLEDACEVQLVKKIDSCGVNGSGNNITNGPNYVSFLRKLIDRGKVNIEDVASEMGIASNSLEAALLGQTSSFFSGLMLKLMRWLQNYAHNLRIRSGSAILPANGVANVESSNAAEVSDPCVDVKVAGLDSPDAVMVKSLPWRRTKSNNGILEDNKTCPPVIQHNGNGKLVDDNGDIPAIIIGDVKKEFDGKISPLQDRGACGDGLDVSDMILDGTGKLTDTNPSISQTPGLKGNLMEIKSNNLSDAHRPPDVTGVVPGIDKVDGAKITAPLTLERSYCVNPDRDNNVGLSSGQPDIIVAESGPSYVHPFIQKMLMQVRGHEVSEQNQGETCSIDDDEKCTCSMEVDTELHSSCIGDKNHALDAAEMDQLAKAKELGILELSPEDEVEEEILYLQSRLIDKEVAIKLSCDELLFMVVNKLPQELDAVNKRGWDMILVNYFLSEVREAKKRGRKERKHKEAQAVLAAAVAAAAPRNSSLRKDANDEIISIHRESPLKVSAASGRSRLCSPLVPQAKDSRTTMAKVSPDKRSVIFRMPQDNVLSCDICRRAETLLNKILVCSSCKVAVHLDCYCKIKNPIISWKCELCVEISSLSRSPINEAVDGRGRQNVHCGLCGAAGGAFRKSTDGQWVHAFCAEWLLESRYTRGQQNPVEGMDTVLNEKNVQSCCICHRNVGVCLKCSYGQCQITFHPSCARGAGFYLNIKSIGGRLQHMAFCEKHSLEQREADNQHGPEELKTVKRLRVELEKVRLLCERINKREKLKRELVLSSHEILAAQRDYVAFSVLVRNSFFPPGASSESATTSINNISYSEAIQRSDDITVDSTVSGEPPVRFSMHSDADRKTEDSSTSHLSFKRKFPTFSNRASFGGKHLPRKPPSVALWNLTENGEKMSNARKLTETFQKELVMTSNQASMQNQRLPKGFAYVPVSRLSKDKPISHNGDSCDPVEPGG